MSYAWNTRRDLDRPAVTHRDILEFENSADRKLKINAMFRLVLRNEMHTLRLELRVEYFRRKDVLLAKQCRRWHASPARIRRHGGAQLFAALGLSRSVPVQMPNTYYFASSFDMSKGILAPAVLLASFSSLLLWGPALLEFAFSILIGIPPSRSANWTRYRSIMTGSRESASWVNHDVSRLLEAPVIFYVLSLALAVAGQPTRFDFCTAWTYAVIRMAYSISWTVQTSNPVRAVLFFSSVCVLQLLTIQCVLQLLAP
jgi:hypothetical protein